MTVYLTQDTSMEPSRNTRKAPAGSMPKKCLDDVFRQFYSFNTSYQKRSEVHDSHYSSLIRSFMHNVWLLFFSNRLVSSFAIAGRSSDRSCVWHADRTFRHFP